MKLLISLLFLFAACQQPNRLLAHFHFEQNPRFSHWLDQPQIAYSPKVCRFAVDPTNEKIIEFSSESKFRKKSNLPQPTAILGQAMTIDYRILIGDAMNEERLQQVRAVIQATFEEVDHLYNDWNPSSEISQLNQLPAHTKIALSRSLESFLHKTGDIVQLTEGKFDPTVASVLKLWRTKLLIGETPTAEELAEFKPAVGWDKIHIADGFFWKDHALTQLDLGGIAKGYCVDLLTERLHALGCQQLFVSWGGEVRTIGQHPSKRPWMVALQSPFTKDAHQTFALTNQAVATSGDYAQYWLSSSQNLYTHICDPHSLQALQITSSSIASATVIADSCMIADAIATALLLQENVSKAEKWGQHLQATISPLTITLLSR